MTFQIEKGIAPPVRKGRKSSYNFNEMEIGDSFLVPIAIGKSPSGLFTAIANAKQRLKINLTTARVEGGIRVWRIARDIEP